jgi:hypothetical protein
LALFRASILAQKERKKQTNKDGFLEGNERNRKVKKLTGESIANGSEKNKKP